MNTARFLVMSTRMWTDPDKFVHIELDTADKGSANHHKVILLTRLPIDNLITQIGGHLQSPVNEIQRPSVFIGLSEAEALSKIEDLYKDAIADYTAAWFDRAMTLFDNKSFNERHERVMTKHRIQDELNALLNRESNIHPDDDTACLLTLHDMTKRIECRLPQFFENQSGDETFTLHLVFGLEHAAEIIMENRHLGTVCYDQKLILRYEKDVKLEVGICSTNVIGDYHIQDRKFDISPIVK